jgi:hypothetical protein
MSGDVLELVGVVAIILWTTFVSITCVNYWLETYTKDECDERFEPLHDDDEGT